MKPEQFWIAKVMLNYTGTCLTEKDNLLGLSIPKQFEVNQIKSRFLILEIDRDES
jgi:hypothetical protein